MSFCLDFVFNMMAFSFIENLFCNSGTHFIYKNENSLFIFCKFFTDFSLYSIWDIKMVLSKALRQS